MQMQDASINSTNTSSYGNGATGAGFTAINNAGNYEFVKASGADQRWRNSNRRAAALTAA